MSPKPMREFASPIRFGSFDLDPSSGVLRKNGIRIRLQEQPFRVLLALLERPGEVVTREQFKETVWANTSFGDFDHSLNIAVNKIREALSDSSATPRYIETMPRRGYRFIATVQSTVTPATEAAPSIVLLQPPRKAKITRLAFVTATIVVLMAGLGLRQLLSSGQPAKLQIRRLTNDNSAKFGPVLTDGARLYFQAGSRFDAYIAQLPMSGGEPLRLPLVLPPGPFIELLDITPNRQELLLTASEKPTWALHQTAPAPLWTLRIADGTTRRVGTLLAQDARYSPSGEQIAFVMGKSSAPKCITPSQTRRTFKAQETSNSPRRRSCV